MLDETNYQKYNAFSILVLCVFKMNSLFDNFVRYIFITGNVFNTFLDGSNDNTKELKV